LASFQGAKGIKAAGKKQPLFKSGYECPVMRIKTAGPDSHPVNRQPQLEGEKNLLESSFRVFSVNLSPAVVRQ